MKKLVTLFTMACVAMTMQAQDIDTDKAALLEIYDALDGPSGWVSSEGVEIEWNEDTDITDFIGITIEGDRVTKLELPGVTGLSGSLPAAIGQLTELTNINFSNDLNLSGTLPDEFFTLSKLTQIYFSNTEITCTIDDRFGQLQALTNIVMDKMPNLTGGIPAVIGTLQNLKFARFADNPGLTGEIDPGVLNAVKLETFQVERTGLTGTVPAGFGKLANLKYLNVNECSFTGMGNLLADGGKIPSTMLEAHKNLIPFGDLLPMKGASRTVAGGWYYRFIEQKPGLKVAIKSFTENDGAIITLDIDQLLPNHGGESFRWLKGGEVMGTARTLAITVSGATIGDYICEITTDQDILSSSICPNCDWQDGDYQKTPAPSTCATNTTEPITISNSSTSIDQLVTSGVFVYSNAKSSIVISSENEEIVGSKFYIINSDGKTIKAGIIGSLKQEVASQANSGIYFVRIVTSKNAIMQKVFIK